VSDDVTDWFDRALEDEDDGDRSESEQDVDDLEDDDTDDHLDDDSARDQRSETDDAADGDSLFEEDFGSALQDIEASEPAAVGDDGDAAADLEGFDDLDFVLGSDEPDFDEELDSELPRIDLGIDGLDQMIQGGVPERSLLVAMGGAGTGKTTFGLQFITHALERDERAVFITLEESRDRVINSATEKGYAFDEYVADGQLAVVDVDPIEMANSLASIRNELPALVEEFDASRLVLDSVSLLEMMYEDRAKRRNEIYDFARSLKGQGSPRC